LRIALQLNSDLREWRQQQDFDLPLLSFAWITEIAINVKGIQQQAYTKGFLLEISLPLPDLLATEP